MVSRLLEERILKTRRRISTDIETPRKYYIQVEYFNLVISRHLELIISNTSRGVFIGRSDKLSE